MPPLLYRVEEAAEALRLSRTAVYELIRSGRLRTVKAGSRRLVPVDALGEYITSLERAAMTDRRTRGDGGLRWHEQRQRWIAEVAFGHDGRGKRIVRSASGRTRTEAKAKLRDPLTGPGRRRHRGKQFGDGAPGGRGLANLRACPAER